jgi:signal peptidase
VRAGDVVCFESPEHDTNIVHRVISVRPSYTVSGHRSPVSGLRSSVPRPPFPVAIRTQGDNNPLPDIRILAPADLLGRVVAAQRGTRLRPIPGGLSGRIIACSVRLRKSVWRAIPGVGSGVYQRLARTGPLEFLLPRGLKPRLVCFSGRDAPVFKLLMGGRTVGHYDCRYRQWCIRRPFRLFVDERTLPDPKSKD